MALGTVHAPPISYLPVEKTSVALVPLGPPLRGSLADYLPDQVELLVELQVVVVVVLGVVLLIPPVAKAVVPALPGL